jgi:phosphoribosyl 1,2-cyclic phosphodiesterase
VALRFASLGSGSGGNGLVVEAGASRVLLDCGFTPRDCERRLARLGLLPTDLAGIVVTHEHDDHIGDALPLAARHGLQVWMTHGTWRAVGNGAPPSYVTLIDSHAAFGIGDLCVAPFPVPHDAREPVQFVFSDGGSRLGVLTDIGAPTRHVAESLSACDALVLECNHDRDMLARGPYPRWLKERIGGPFGHLANEAAADLLAMLDMRRLRHVVAAHLSESNNTPALARAALADVLGCAADWIGVASQESGFDWREL